MQNTTLTSNVYGQWHFAYALHTIEVDFLCFDSFIRAFQPHGGVIPAPNSIDISLCEIEFELFRCPCEMYHAGVGEIRCLLHILAKRAEAGNMLPRLDLVGCTNTIEDDVMELSVVGQIEYPYTQLGVECEATCQSEDCLPLPRPLPTR